MGTARHQVIPGTLGRAAGQDGRFQLQEAMLVQKAPQYPRGLGAHQQGALCIRTTQIEIAVTQPQGLGDLFVHGEGQPMGLCQHHQVVHRHLHLACGQAFVLRARRPTPHHTFNLEHVLGVQPFGHGKGLRLDRVHHQLHQAQPIAQIHEDDATMVAAPLHPAAQLNVVVDQAGICLATGMAAHGSGCGPAGWLWHVVLLGGVILHHACAMARLNAGEKFRSGSGCIASATSGAAARRAARSTG